MTQRSVEHATFVIERNYDASPDRVFAAWADPAAKTRWFSGPAEWTRTEHELDFRVGGREVSRVASPDGPVYTYEARYQDIVANSRIIYGYDMYLDDRRISVSLATVELEPDGAGTRLIFTEQDVFLDSLDGADQREQGSHMLLDALDAELQRAAAANV
jgi:uncharacterized protein YndB with AHSA1/START domain